MIKDMTLLRCVCIDSVSWQIATSVLLYGHDYLYPKHKIEESWEKVLLNQCKFICLAYL